MRTAARIQKEYQAELADWRSLGEETGWYRSRMRELVSQPLTAEDVMNVIHTEQPFGVVVAFGGQTAIKLTRHLVANGVNILGTPADSIDAAEDRERFEALLNELNIKRPRGLTVKTTEQALSAARELGYPVLIRPSYVLGGQNMIIAFGDDEILEYMGIILRQGIDNPILIDQYLAGTEIEVMNRRYLGENGHIGIATRSMERAIDDMEKRGFSLDMDTAKYSGERIKAVYLKNEIGGFAVHLMQK